MISGRMWTSHCKARKGKETMTWQRKIWILNSRNIAASPFELCIVHFVLLLVPAANCQSSSANTPSPQRCASLAEVSELMWQADTSRLTFANSTASDAHADIIVNFRNNRLFQFVNTSRLSSPIWSHFDSLLGSYNPQPAKDDLTTDEEYLQIKSLLQSASSTGPIQELAEYLLCRGLISNNSELECKLNQIWFEGYYRYTEAFGLDSSGFERVFVGETDFFNRSQVAGLYNWYRLYSLEENSSAIVTGYQGFAEPNILAVTFTWDNREQNNGVMFLGSSPAFELAVYTLCYLGNGAGQCNISLNGHPVTIYTEDHGGQLGTAYPGMSPLPTKLDSD